MKMKTWPDISRSITLFPEFEDSVQLFRWSDDSVVREAKKMVSGSNHIPKKRLIELVDLHKPEGGDGSEAESFQTRDVRDRPPEPAQPSTSRPTYNRAGRSRY